MNIETITPNKTLIIMLEQLLLEAEEVSGQWDGDNSGRLENIAHNADDIRETVDSLLDLLKESEEV